MNRAIVVYVVGLVLVVIVALVLSGYLGGGMGVVTTTATTSVAQGANTATTTTTIKGPYVTVPTTSVYFSQCQSASETEPILNGNFSTGSYYGWNVSGAGFGTGPLNLTNANKLGFYYSGPWRGYSGTYAATNYHGLSVQGGNLTSEPFEVTEPYLNFRIISAADSQLYVEIIDGKNVSRYWYNTYNATGNANATSSFVNASIPLLNTAYLCQNVTVRIVAGAVGIPNMLDYIAAGDFYLSRTPRTTPYILVNESVG